MQTTPAIKRTPFTAPRALSEERPRGSEADTRSPKGEPVVSRREGEGNKSATVGAPRRRH